MRWFSNQLSRWGLALAFGLALLSPTSAQTLLCPAQCLSTNGYGPASGAVAGPQFFVAAPGNGGSDSNPGTQASPWATIAKVNSSATAGSTVKFNGGDTFTTTTGITALVNVTSYGTGLPTISSGNSASCVSQTNPSGLTISNLICTGGGNLTNTTAGISIQNNQAGNTKLPGPTISGVTVSSYGGNGIEIKGTNGTSGFNHITVSNSTVHDVTGNSTASVGTAGIYIFAGPGYGSGITAPAHTNVLVDNCLVYNANGTVGSTNWTGSGIVLAQVQFGTVQNSTTHDFAALGIGGVGIWTFDADSITIQKNEAYNGRTSGVDGDGFDIDGGVTNSVMQYNYAHDNVGAGFLYTAYNDGTVTTFNNNVMRFNISQNNLTAEYQWTLNSQPNAPVMSNASVYNNTAFCGKAQCFLVINNGGSFTGTNFVANNIFYGVKGGTVVQAPLGASSMTLTGNDYYCSILGGSCNLNYTWAGTTYTTFASWQTATGQEKIAGVNVGQTVNPLIYAPGAGLTNGGYVPTALMAYNLQSTSTMNGAGVDVAAQYSVSIGTQDYYGNAITTKLIGAANGDFSSFVASCTPSSSFVARMTTPTKLDEVIANYLTCALNASGDLANLDFLHFYAFASQTNALLNLVSSTYNNVATNSPTFTAGQGFTGNGSNAYLAPSSFTAFSKASLNSISAGVYDLTSRTSGGGNNSIGAQAASAYFGVWALTTANPFFSANENTGFSAGSVTNSQGLTALIRTASNAEAAFRNGTSVATSATASVAMPTSLMTTLGFNSATTPPTVSLVQATTDQIAMDFVGNGSVSMTNISSILNTSMVAKGINVY